VIHSPTDFFVGFAGCETSLIPVFVKTKKENQQSVGCLDVLVLLFASNFHLEIFTASISQ
jgi:hypothetical protein